MASLFEDSKFYKTKKSEIIASGLIMLGLSKMAE